MGRFKKAAEIKVNGRNADNYLDIHELMFDRDQYHQELQCAYSIIKRHGLEREYVGAIQATVQDIKIRFSILECITEGRKILGRDIKDYNNATKYYIKSNLRKLQSEVESDRVRRLNFEIETLKRQIELLKSESTNVTQNNQISE